MTGIGHLIICSPYDEPAEHWRLGEGGAYERAGGRRPAGYVAARRGGAPDDPGEFEEIPLANEVRARVGRWRAAGYPGVTGVTRQLLEHWRGGQGRDEARLFFCQLEAIETLIWMAEAPAREREGLEIPSDGGPFPRLCSKMATGSGKTVVMAMLIAWQALNSGTYPGDGRFSRDFLVVAPGLTVRSRLGVLWPPDADGSYYRAFSLVPGHLYGRLRGARVAIRNWHTLSPLRDPEHGVVRRGEEGDEAFARRVLGPGGGPVVVINDEAHHAWRSAPGRARATREQREAEEEATVWVGGLDRLHRARGVSACYDFTATPFTPSGGTAARDDLFGWIVSDFSLNDAIESGLVKTPRMPAGDDVGEIRPTDVSSYYHLYAEEGVRAGLSSRAPEDRPLPDIVRNAYVLLASDWRRTREAWGEFPVPPVMITVCNNTRTSARIARFFGSGPHDFGALAAEGAMLQIDTAVMNLERGKGGAAGAEGRREALNTVGQPGRAGERVCNIVAVQMLSEGWDAKNVTQIMGLRAFASQLLCEQVVGRGLRRSSYEADRETGLLRPEYVNVLGVPFSFLPHERADSEHRPDPPKVRVAPDPRAAAHEIAWPNADGVETVVRPVLDMDWGAVGPVEVSARRTSVSVSVAPMLAGGPDVRNASEISIRDSYGHLRTQTIMFHTIRDVYSELAPAGWEGDRAQLFLQVSRIVAEFLRSGRVRFVDMQDDSEIRRRLALMFNMQAVVQHIHAAIRARNAVSKRLALRHGRQTRSTADMQPWYSMKDHVRAAKSHVLPAVCDSGWERRACAELDRSARVTSWAKNDRLGFSVRYEHEGEERSYYPDFLVRLRGGATLVLEVKGRKSGESDAKRDAMREWAEVATADGRFGRWKHEVAYHWRDIPGIIQRSDTEG